LFRTLQATDDRNLVDQVGIFSNANTYLHHSTPSFTYVVRASHAAGVLAVQRTPRHAGYVKS
jgi:hypothetical protein